MVNRDVAYKWGRIMDSQNRFQDRSIAHGQDAASRAGPRDTTGSMQIDPVASAALAEAIRSAKQGLRPFASPSPQPACGEADVPEKALGHRTSRYRLLSQAALALVLIGVGWFVSYMGTLANRDAIHRLETETARSQEILARLSGDLQSLKETLAAFRDVEQTSSVTSASDRAKLTEQVERLAVAVQDPAKTFTVLETRLERMESQIMANLASLAAKPPAPAPAPPPAPAAAAEEAPALKPVKSEPLNGWVLREVYDGAALIEGQNRRLYEVMPGGVLPGVGRVEAIERRGRGWVVLTDKGFIGSAGTYR